MSRTANLALQRTTDIHNYRADGAQVVARVWKSSEAQLSIGLGEIAATPGRHK
jgi:hypothetical protein